MPYKWIAKNQSDKLIVFFNGWGMDERVIEHMDTSGMDILMFYKYSQSEAFSLEKIQSYKSRYLVAYSLGVFMACEWLSRHKISFDYSIAINGTIFPIDHEKGISEAIYEGTHDYLSEESLRKFNRRMFSDRNELERFNLIKSSFTIEQLKNELNFIKTCYKKQEQWHCLFDKAYIGLQDQIFLPDRQRKAWEGTHTEEHQWSHFPWFKFESWKAILNKK
ncbi:MAG: DUF452 family protein [Bacteroidales bacterium]|nr:DUF452 family protein [Bacteroidales bacterium]